ncbi:MAG: sulfite exporter TauE/SafE family protein, partial [Solirubrobacteraceae bacterium]
MLDAPIVLGSALVGFLVGMTGAGGGALMTPMLILVFSVKPSVAISSDLVAALVMRPFAAAVHFHRGTVNLRLAAWTTAGSVPAAFLGSYLLHLVGDGAHAETAIEVTVGGVLLVGACAMAVRSALDRRRASGRSAVALGEGSSGVRIGGH